MRTLQVSTPAREPLLFVLPLAHGIGHRAGFASYRGGRFRHRLALGAPLARCRRLSAKLLSVVHDIFSIYALTIANIICMSNYSDRPGTRDRLNWQRNRA